MAASRSKVAEIGPTATRSGNTLSTFVSAPTTLRADSVSELHQIDHPGSNKRFENSGPRLRTKTLAIIWIYILDKQGVKEKCEASRHEDTLCGHDYFQVKCR